MNKKTITYGAIAAAALAAYYFVFRKGSDTATGATIAATTMPYFMPNASQSTSGATNDPVAANAAPGSLRGSINDALGKLGTAKPAPGLFTGPAPAAPVYGVTVGGNVSGAAPAPSPAPVWADNSKPYEAGQLIRF